MANTQTLAIPGKPHSAVKEVQKTREPITLAKWVKRILGIDDRSEPKSYDEPYFGL